MQKATTPKRFYIDHTANEHTVKVRTVSCALPRKSEHVSREMRQPATEAERLFSAGRLIRTGILRKR